ncbi:hypothetical protein [Mesorhizobium kowhaii]|uniref:Uncharacterized protein n=1 Tax=Mesorhizobium kowhaii TaxID=1300272 RepID=A0A2W7CBK0_9HYPH|nr:hypothetical protein [Mesorhizobium kowhaii]PZV39651.1 hypothetical protein B5V02_06840 [Mesorhizobium kowhaii]
MTVMKTRRLSREEFVNWIAEAADGLPTLPRDIALRGSRPNDVTLVWPEHQSDARPVICVAESQLQDLFAFVSTYSTNLRPYTAYFRVIPLELIDILDNGAREHRNETRLARMIAGASIAEAWLAAARQSGRPSNVVPLLQSSLSSALGQVVLAGYNDLAFDWVQREWIETRAGLGDNMSDQNCEGISLAWRLVLAAMTTLSQAFLDRSGKLIATFIADAVEAKSVRPSMLRSLSVIAGPELDLVKLLAAPREERISRFNATIADFKSSGARGLQAEFLAGLMLAIAGNGSFDMIRSAREFDGWLDGAATWFGICAALFDESNVLAYANSAGRRVVRDLLRRDDPFGLPSRDIASTEFRFLETNKSDVFQLGAYGPGSVEVEILPNVATRILSRDSGQSGRSAEEREMLLRTMDEMSHLAERARRILQGPERAERQGDPYKPKRPNRYR